MGCGRSKEKDVVYFSRLRQSWLNEISQVDRMSWANLDLNQKLIYFEALKDVLKKKKETRRVREDLPGKNN